MAVSEIVYPVIHAACTISRKFTRCILSQVQLWYGSIDENPYTVHYSVYFAAWSILFLARWRREEIELSFLWGNEEYGGTEDPR